MKDSALTFTGKKYSPYVEYWADRISILNSPFKIANGGGGSPAPGKFKRYSFALDGSRQSVVDEITQGRALEAFITFISGYYILFSKYGGSEEVVINTPLFKHGEVEKVFASEVSLIEKISPDDTIKEVILKANRTVTQGYKYQNFPLEFIRKSRGGGGSGPLSNIFISFDAIHENCEPRESYDLIIDIKRGSHGGSILTGITYNTEAFEEYFIHSLAGHFKNVISYFKAIDSKVRNIDILSESERALLLDGFNDTKTDYPKDKTIVELFEDQVEKTPENTAVAFGGARISYRELNERANRMARLLRGKYRVRPDDPVGLILDRSEWMITSIFGILKAGGAYLPIEPDTPMQRIRHMLREAGSAVVITTRALAGGYEGFASRENNECELLLIEDLAELIPKETAENPGRVNKPSDLAYVMFTSGSTGKPKGVLAGHRNVIRLVKNTNYTDIKPDDRILQLSNYAFDGSTYDIFGALLNGAALYMLPKDTIYSLDELCAFIRDNKINMTFITTALINKLIDADPTVIGCFDRIYFGGQDASLKHIRTAVRHRKNEDSIVHVYGPTEATTFSTHYVVRELKNDDTSIPIGAPIGNSKAYILDEHLNPLPIGVEGEIYVGGDGIARGYLNNEELTAEKFLDSPFVKGDRLYRTGDVGKWIPSGDIDFLGRKDQQFKIRGFRVETAEIENSLLNHPAIKQAFVTAGKAEDGNRELVAYIVSEEEELSVSSVREHLAGELPDYMVPAYFVRLDSMPLNSNGKVDTNALPPPEDSSLTGAAYEKPRNEVEEKLAGVWQKVLKRKRVGVHDNYFVIGGDSIKAIQIVAKLARLNLKLKVRDLFQYPTIAELAGRVAGAEREAEQGPVSGLVPLTAIQTWFFGEHGISANHFNQAVLLRSGNRLNEEALRAVFEKLQEHHDALRSRYRLEGGDIIQEIQGPDCPLHFEAVDLTGSADAPALLESHAERIHAGIRLDTGPLMKAALFRMDDGDRLLVTIHHLAIDGVSWRILYEDITRGYKQYLAGETVDFGMKTDSFKRWAELVRRYGRSEAILEEMKYWRAVENQAAMLQTDYPQGEGDVDRYGDSRTVTACLSEEQTGLLLTRAHEAYRTEMNDLLLTALARAMCDWRGGRETLIALEGHGREPVGGEDIDVSRTVGWFTSVYPVVLKLPQKDEPGSHIKHIKESLRSVPDKGVGYGILKYLSQGNAGGEAGFPAEPRISFNYLGSFDADVDGSVFEIAEESFGRTINPEMKRGHDLEIISMVVKGRLEFSISYGSKLFREETIRRLASAYKRELAEIIVHCMKDGSSGLTPSDIDYSGLSIEELDNVLDSLQSGSRKRRS
ncbi:MAG: amino acid adenylation domain-containing protein [bacterium]